MTKPWEFFERMNALVYVSDMDTYEMIYMNQKAREAYGFAAMSSFSGMKCYDILHNASCPCSFCNNHQLQPGYFKEWHYFNEVLQKYVSLKDSMVVEDGRRLRIEITLDETFQAEQTRTINKYQNLEALANEGFQRALKAPTPDEGINVILEYLGTILDGQRTYIFEHNEQGGDDNTYEWCAEGVTAEKDNLQNLPADVCDDWYRRFKRNQNVMIEDLEDIRESDPELYAVLKPQDIESLVVVPLYDGDRVIGFYGVDNPPVYFLEQASNIMQITASFIITSLKRRNNLRMLHEMSYHDQLTGLGNRYALQECIDSLSASESLGVLFCDITGLKRINDTEGHIAGDQLILRACACLKGAFGDYELYRIGGDELLAICPGIAKADMERRICCLKECMPANNVLMAIGMVWQECGEIDIDRLLYVSEQEMYKEKSAWYKKSGIERRR